MDGEQDPNLQMTTALSTKRTLTGPWGGGGEISDICSLSQDNVRLEHEKLMGKFTIVSGTLDGFVILRDVVKGMMVSATQAHSGPIVAI